MRLDPPLVPDGDEARSLLRRELLRPEYNEANLLQRFFDWVSRSLDRGVNTASNASPLSTFAALVLLVLLALALAWLISRLRSSVRAPKEDQVPVLEPGIDAAELRRRAEGALAAGDYSAAVLDGFRAVAARQVEAERLPDNPGATAAEVTAALVTEYPHASTALSDAGRLFDAVAYGHRPATADQARGVLGLDEVLAVRR